MKKRIAIVEDELLIAEGLIDDLESLGYVSIRPHCASYKDAVEGFKKEKPDLALLDIRLIGEKTGVDLALYIQKHCDFPYIFLTANFNLKLFDPGQDLKPAGILTKPFHINNLFATIEFALKPSLTGQKEMVVLPGAHKRETILLKDILYISAEKNYSDLYLADRKLTIRITLKEIMDLLGDESFMQVHRSYIVGVDHIVGFKAAAIFVGPHKVPIGRAYKEELLARLKRE